MSSRRRTGALVVAGVVVAVVAVALVVVATAPANWLARFVASRSGGQLVLADADGTIWSGSAVLAIGGARGPGGAGAALALPGRVTWTLDLSRPLAPVLHLTQDAVLRQPVDLRYVGGDVEVAAGSASLPASLLSLAGAPLNTLRPDGRCRVDWDALRWTRDGTLVGTGTLTVESFSVAISPVRPLGDYRVTWRSDRDGLAWTLATERGPLEATGSGRVGRAVAVHVTARVAPGTPLPVAARLGPLLDAIGRRPDGEAAFDLGPR